MSPSGAIILDGNIGLQRYWAKVKIVIATASTCVAKNKLTYLGLQPIENFFRIDILRSKDPAEDQQS
jgi:hypothetical protein